MKQRKVLFVLTGHDRLGDASDASADKTGFHLSEAAKPWSVLKDAGFDVDFATPEGGHAPIDPSSKDMEDKDNVAFLGNDAVKKSIENAPSLGSTDTSDYDAIYFPGGHGTMWDLPENEAVQTAIRQMYENGKVVGAVCHGPAAFVNAKLSDGSYLVDGKTIATFTDEEEKAVEKDSLMPFLLGSKLEQRGATLKKADNFQPSIAISDRLVTGQNPASAQGVGEAIRDLVNEKVAKAA